MVISCSPITFKGLEGGLEEAMVKGNPHKRQLYSMFEASDQETAGEEDAAEEYSRHVEKKRRLTADQVKALEKNFEVENKLEPERKVLLARELGLQPRQVAVWFQNRRARWKTKQLEKDYEILKADYDALKREYDVAVKEKENLQAQALCLSEKLRPLTDGEKPRRGASISETRESFAKSSMHLLNQVSNESTTQLNLNSVNHLLIVKAAGKEGSTSSDSDDSEVQDVESPLIPLEHFPICSELPNLVCADPPSLTNIENCNYEKAIPHHIKAQRSIVKLEDESYSEENSSYFLNLEDQATGFPWWEWS